MTGRALAGGSAVGFSAGWNIADTGAIAGDLADAYGVGLAVVGLLTTALFVTHLVMQLPSGRLSDRYGAWRVCLAGAGVLAACNVLAALAPAAWLGATARTLMGVGTALSFIGGSDYVRAAGGSPFAQGLYGGIATAGGGVALAVVPALVAVLDWRSAYLSAIAVAVVAAAVMLTCPRVHPTPGAHALGSTPLQTLVRDTRLLRLAVLFAGSFGLNVVVGNWVVTLLERRDLAAAGVAGAIGALTLVLGAVSRPIGGWILREHPAATRASIAAAGLVAAAGTLALAFAPLPLAAAGALVVGLAAGIPFAPAFTASARLYPLSPATAVGLVNGSGALTVLVLTPLVGLAFSQGGGPAAFAVIAALWAACLLVLPRATVTVAPSATPAPRSR